VLTETDRLVLIALARLGDEAYAVTIRQEITACARRQVSLAAVYAALDRLEHRKAAEAWLSEPVPERGGRARRQYRLTARGRDLVRREREIALAMWSGVTVAPGGHE
jgi:PadR family transcriptional regulator, regulatory protein PadR